MFCTFITVTIYKQEPKKRNLRKITKKGFTKLDIVDILTKKKKLSKWRSKKMMKQNSWISAGTKPCTYTISYAIDLHDAVFSELS